MTLAEFYSCALFAFGPPLAMFIITIAGDPIRIIILVVAAFAWLLALLLSSLFWFAVVPLRSYLSFGLVFSVALQEVFRYGMYLLLRKSETGLREVAGTQSITDNKHILAYVCGLGFGIMSGAFSSVNVLADAYGPATVGLTSGSEYFFLTSSATTLCFILLHTFWSVIFFDAVDKKNYINVSWVVLSHLLVSCLTLLNRFKLYYASILPAYLILLVTMAMAFRSAGGSYAKLKQCLTKKTA